MPGWSDVGQAKITADSLSKVNMISASKSLAF